jgi:Domain of unknown function (DUF5668)
MNCYLHPETPAVAFCRSCGRSLCGICQRPAEGTIFCQDHVPVSAYTPQSAPDPTNPYSQPSGAPLNTPVRTSPGLAFILGFIPGVGAIYNGQYLKGLVHALVFGLLITIIGNTPGASQPLIAILLGAFVFYMPFEAYHTAKKREMGLAVDEWSSILPRSRHFGRAPVGPIVLIAIGVLYLLNTLDLVDFRQIGRFWPVILIVVGAYMLYSRVTTANSAPPPSGQPYADPRAGAPTPNDLMGTRHE